MDVNMARRQSQVMQNMLEALIRFDIVQEDEITCSAESIVSIERLWLLFRKSEALLEEVQESQHAELQKVNEYIAQVRSVSDERDCLMNDLEEENEKLKKEMKQMKEKADAEAAEVTGMCQQENLDELVGSTFSEQMAYLLVVRGTLLDKLEVAEEKHDEVLHRYNEAAKQLESLTSEDSDLRLRMENAMSEMGGMASKLTDALKERDKLKKEVAELTQALDAIQTLPTVNQARAESLTQQQQLDEMRQFYTEETQKLRDDLRESKEKCEGLETEYKVQIEELQEMNNKLKEVNKKLNEHLNEPGENLSDGNRKQVYAESQRIIEEMQIALQEDEAKTLAQEEEYEKIIKELKERILELESHQTEVFDGDHAEYISAAQLSAELSEAKQQLQKQYDKVDKLHEDLREAERGLTIHKATSESRKEQLENQVKLATDLQTRNANLENELTKVWRQLKEALDKSNALERERGRLELMLKDDSQAHHPGGGSQAHHPGGGAPDNEVKELKDKISNLESLLFRETSGSNKEDNVMELKKKLQLYEASIKEEISRRDDLEKRFASSQSSLDKMVVVEEEMRRNLSEFQQRALNAEAQILLISGQKDEQETQNLLTELDRNQLEDAIDMLTKRNNLYTDRLHSYADRYNNLKQKHRSKIRRIRELFLSERKATSDEMERLERRLQSAEEALGVELAWKDEAAESVRSAEKDRRNALNQANIAIRSAEDRNEQIKQLNGVKDELKSRNSMLQKQLVLLERQKVELERIVHSKQRKHQQEELNTLLSSLNMSGSLPNMGNSLPRIQSKSDSSVSEVHTEDYVDDLSKSPASAKKIFSSSYLHLSPNGEIPKPVKRTLV